MRRIQQDNINKITQEGFGLTPGVPVKVYNERNAMAKRRSELEPGHWHVVGRDGMKFIIEDENGKQQTKARCKIANTWE